MVNDTDDLTVGTPSWDQVVRDSTKVARGGQEPSSKAGIPHSSQKGVEDGDTGGKTKKSKQMAKQARVITTQEQPKHSEQQAHCVSTTN